MLEKLLDLSGQVAIVTGANRGIGRATAQVLHAAGANVVLQTVLGAHRILNMLTGAQLPRIC